MPNCPPSIVNLYLLWTVPSFSLNLKKSASWQSLSIRFLVRITISSRQMILPWRKKPCRWPCKASVTQSLSGLVRRWFRSIWTGPAHVTVAYTKQTYISLSHFHEVGRLAGIPTQSSGPWLLPAPPSQDVAFQPHEPEWLLKRHATQPHSRQQEEQVNPVLLRRLSRTNTHYFCFHLVG